MGSVLRDVAVILAVVGIVLFVIGSVAMAGALWARRLWRRKKAAFAVQLSGLALGAGAAGMRWLWTRPIPDRRWRSLHRARRELIKSSYGAELAVREARAAAAPLGDLESLSRRLSSAAVDVDRSLRIAQKPPAPTGDISELIRQSHELATAGLRIQRAAALALASTHSLASRELAAHVRIEEQAIAGTLG